ncbi:MAG: GumC family protein, partial [Thermodesulfobacteriota bacterium]
MFNLSRPLRPEDYLAMVKRRFSWILIPFVVVSLAGIAIVFQLPKVYRSSTLILLIPQRVPTEYIKPTVTESIEERIHSITTQILSRTNLLTVINEFGLYKEEAGKLSQEELIEKMRKNVEIQLKGGQQRGQRTDAFEVFFAGSDPKTVMMVTNRLASLFIEQNLKIREQQAEGTASFLADQLKKTEADLQRQEQEITAYKTKHMGELPEQMQANLGILQQLQIQYQRVVDGIR